jgi:hypothetical protein
MDCAGIVGRAGKARPISGCCAVWSGAATTEYEPAVSVRARNARQMPPTDPSPHPKKRLAENSAISVTISVGDDQEAVPPFQ